MLSAKGTPMKSALSHELALVLEEVLVAELEGVRQADALDFWCVLVLDMPRRSKWLYYLDDITGRTREFVDVDMHFHTVRLQLRRLFP